MKILWRFAQKKTEEVCWFNIFNKKFCFFFVSLKSHNTVKKKEAMKELNRPDRTFQSE